MTRTTRLRCISFVCHPHMWDDDIVPADPIDARRIGMAWLAAADWADKLRARDLAP